MSTLSDFKTTQKTFERVRTAYKEKEGKVLKNLKSHNLNVDELQLFIRCFKEEKTVELWSKNETSLKYTLIETYDFCASSGTLGPKRKEGDNQTPEGFYIIDRFNPKSNFYLSLGINYPNASDKIRGTKYKLGGDIFIHGNCVTIGCIPITDDKIKELYLYCVEAKNNGHSIPVHIFPAKLSEDNYTALAKKYTKDKALLAFWKELQAGYKHFETNKKLPTISVDALGKYNVK